MAACLASALDLARSARLALKFGLKEFKLERALAEPDSISRKAGRGTRIGSRRANEAKELKLKFDQEFESHSQVELTWLY